MNCSWGPDGRHLVTSTTSPRLRVDNGWKVFHYNGDMVAEQKAEVLLQVEFGPAASTDLFCDRPASPDKIKKGREASKGGAGRPAAYVPPHLKGKGRGASSGSTFSLAYDKSENGPGKIKQNQGYQRKTQSNLPPGAELATNSKAASKNAKRRAKKRAQQEAQAENPDQSAGPAEDPPRAEEAAAEESKQEAPAGAPVVVDAAKRIRNLEKKLRQIDQIKAKPKGDLTPEQLKKLETEDEIRKEIEAQKIK